MTDVTPTNPQRMCYLPDNFSFPKHGGSIAEIETIFGSPAQEWLDLSTAINPWPYPISSLPDSVWHRLPEVSHLMTTVDVVRSYSQTPKEAGIIAAPGSQAVIQLLPRLIAPTSVAIIGPTYCEHQYCWNMAGHHTVIVHEPKHFDRVITDYKIVIVTNPNNPTGRTIDSDTLLWVTKKMAENNGLLVVDEAFADIDPHSSMAPYAGQEALIIIRSFGKFFGLAGLRLGFAITTQELAKRLRTAFGPWAVSGPALAIAQQAYQDDLWIQNTRTHLRTAAHTLDTLLAQHRLCVIGGTSLFRLIQTPDARALFTKTCYAGIMLRGFEGHPTWLRVGLPPHSDALERLSRAISTVPKDNLSQL